MKKLALVSVITLLTFLVFAQRPSNGGKKHENNARSTAKSKAVTPQRSNKSINYSLSRSTPSYNNKRSSSSSTSTYRTSPSRTSAAKRTSNNYTRSYNNNHKAKVNAQSSSRNSSTVTRQSANRNSNYQNSNNVSNSNRNSTARTHSPVSQKSNQNLTVNKSRSNVNSNVNHNRNSRNSNARGYYGDRGRNSHHSATRHAHTSYKPNHNYGVNYHHSRHYHCRVPGYRDARYHWNHHYVRPYRYPRHIHIVWTNDMYRYYRVWYPDVIWRIDVGTSINTISAFDAQYYIGDVKRVYGRVHEAFYDYNTNSYYLYFSAPYPYHKFSVVIPGDVEDKFRRDILSYYKNEYVEVTGLITSFNGKPEVVIQSPSQIDRY